MRTITLKSKLAVAGVAAVTAAVPLSALAISTAQASPLNATATVNWQIPLKGSSAYPTANGSAQYQSQPGQREVQVEVQHVRSLAGKKVVFSAGGMTLGQATVSALGLADITRNTELGQKVPVIVHGSAVAVRTTGGVLIVSGRF
jgi:hypothetical protein